MDVAEPVLRAIGARLGGDCEAIVVAGNHDAALMRPWVRERAASVGLDTSIPLDATPALEQVVSWLAPARVRAHYPGVWLTDRVWATHGHYLDRHLLPEVAYGFARGALGRLPRDGATPADYERAGGPSLTRVEALMTRWLPRPLAEVIDDVAEALRAFTMPAIPRRLLAHRVAPLNAMLLGMQMRRASIPALGARRAPPRRRRRLGDLRPRPSLRPARRPTTRAAGAAPAGARRSRTPAHGSTSRCSCTAPRRRTPTGPAERSLLEDGRDPKAIGLLDHLDAETLHRSPVVGEA